MKYNTINLFVLLGICFFQWVLPEAIEANGPFLKSEINEKEYTTWIEDPEFVETMEAVSQIGLKSIEASQKKEDYKIWFYPNPDEKDLQQEDLHHLMSNMGYGNMDAFNAEFHDFLIKFKNISLKYPEINHLTIDEWVAILNQIHFRNPDLLWKGNPEECDDWCIAEAYAAFLVRAGALASGVLATSPMPPLSALILIGGSLYSVLKFINDMRKCCK